MWIHLKTKRVSNLLFLCLSFSFVQKTFNIYTYVFYAIGSPNFKKGVM